MKLAWFWTFDPPALWAGISGKVYPKSREIEPVRDNNTSANAACEVFTRQVSPYAASCIPSGKTPTLYPNKHFE